MNPEKFHKIMKKIVILFSVIWGIFLFPSILIMSFLLTNTLEFANQNEAVRQVLYYSLMSYPFILIISISLSWFFIWKKRYWAAIIISLIPLLNLFIELIAVDIALLLA